MKKSDELIAANKELAFQNEEKDKREAESLIANAEKAKLADELVIVREEKTELATENYQYLLKYN